jgi:hypothetical protein
MVVAQSEQLSNGTGCACGRSIYCTPNSKVILILYD